MAKQREVPREQRCFFCEERWIVAVGGQRLCEHHHQLVEEIAADAGVPIHITVHRLTRPEPNPPQHIGEIIPKVLVDVLSNAKPALELTPTTNER
jgi:hypothetical protein